MKRLSRNSCWRLAEVGKVIWQLPKAWSSLVGHRIAEIELMLGVFAYDERARTRDIGGFVPFLLIGVVLHQVAAIVLQSLVFVQKSVNKYCRADNADDAHTDVEVNADCSGLKKLCHSSKY